MPQLRSVEPDGAAIRARREDLGLTQAELAKLTGGSAQTISDLECGRRPNEWKPSALLIGKIARALGVESKALIKGQAAA